MHQTKTDAHSDHAIKERVNDLDKYQLIEHLTNKCKLYREALEEIEDLLREDSFENDDKCIEIAHEALRF